MGAPKNRIVRAWRADARGEATMRDWLVLIGAFLVFVVGGYVLWILGAALLTLLTLTEWGQFPPGADAPWILPALGGLLLADAVLIILGWPRRPPDS